MTFHIVVNWTNKKRGMTAVGKGRLENCDKYKRVSLAKLQE
jgi:hypothetical protein